jgi:hypothetical protein
MLVYYILYYIYYYLYDIVEVKAISAIMIITNIQIYIVTALYYYY